MNILRKRQLKYIFFKSSISLVINLSSIFKETFHILQGIIQSTFVNFHSLKYAEYFLPLNRSNYFEWNTSWNKLYTCAFIWIFIKEKLVQKPTKEMQCSVMFCKIVLHLLKMLTNLKSRDRKFTMFALIKIYGFGYLLIQQVKTMKFITVYDSQAIRYLKRPHLSCTQNPTWR